MKIKMQIFGAWQYYFAFLCVLCRAALTPDVVGAEGSDRGEGRMNVETEAHSTPETERIIVTGSPLNQFENVSGTKDGASVLESPRSVSVLTEKRISILGANTVQSALGYVSGVYNGPYGNDARGDWSVIRGVEPVQYLDGLKYMFGYYNNTRPSPYTLQQIEILKGPSSVLYGQGSTGGIVNLQSKRPMLSSHSEVWLQFGNYNRQQLAIDTGGPIGSSNFLYRLTGIARESDTQTDYVKDNNYQLSPALTWLATDSTTITLLANVQRQESGSSVQFLPREGTLLPAPNGQIPSNRFVSEPDWDRYDADQRALTAIIDTNFNANLAFTTSARYSESTVVYRTMYGWPPVLREDGASIQRLAYASDASSKAFTADSRIHGTFATGPIDHNLIVGVDVQRATVDDDNGFGNGGQFNLYNPTYGYQPEPFDLDDNPANTVTQEGLYIQDSVYFGSGWIFSGAVRFDNTSSETEGSDTQESSATTNRLALMHIFDGGLSTYASYGESFDPVLGFDAYGDTFEPKRGKQVEYGIKYQPTGTKHLVTLSYFDIVEKNRTTPLPISSMSDPDVEDPSGMVQTGEVEINGIEFETQLEFDLLEVYASYSTNESEITKSNTLGEEGAELSATPQEMYSLWLSYWPQILGRKFRIGSGYRFIGRTSDGSAEITAPDGTVEHAPRYTPSYDMIDFMIGYQFGKFDVSFNVANVEDETVISACLARGDCFYAQRRTITSNLKYTF